MCNKKMVNWEQSFGTEGPSLKNLEAFPGTKGISMIFLLNQNPSRGARVFLEKGFSSPADELESFPMCMFGHHERIQSENT